MSTLSDRSRAAAPTHAPGHPITRLLDAAVSLDQPLLERIVREIVDTQGIDDAVEEVLIPTLREVGDLWERGKIGVVHEHALAHAMRAAVAGGGDLPPAGAGLVVLACPPGELHDLPFDLFAAQLRRRGCRCLVLGASTPWRGLMQSVLASGARAVVIAARRPRALEARLSTLARLGKRTAVFVAGPGAEALVDLPAGVRRLSGGWADCADEVARACAPGRVEPVDRPRVALTAAAPADETTT